MSGGPKRRVFVAVPLPPALLSHVQEAQGALEPVTGLRLLAPEQLHVTLAFIGHVEEELVEAAREVVSGVPEDWGGVVSLDGYLAFPSARRARVVTLGIEDTGGVFGRVFEGVMSGLEERGVMEREKRPFRPHLTIARLRSPGPIQLKSHMERVEFPVRSVCLYESKLRRTGAEYTVLERRPLETAGD